MCRITIASGNFEVAKVIDSIIFMAQDQNSSHERNTEKGLGSYTHPDGWGVAYLSDKGLVIKKSTKAIFKDPLVDQLRKIKTDFMFIHVRKESCGKVSLKNTHPFKARHPLLGECLFCHNGTIKDQILFDASYKSQGSTDSERLFYSILSDITENEDLSIAKKIQQNLQKYPETKGSNIVLATLDKTYVAIRKNQLPKYFGMMLGQGKDFLLISSEKLKTFPDIKWRSILPEEVVIIQNGTTSFSVRREKKSIIQKVMAKLL